MEENPVQQPPAYNQVPTQAQTPVQNIPEQRRNPIPGKRIYKLIIALIVVNMIGFAGLQLLIRNKKPDKPTSTSSEVNNVSQTFENDTSTWKTYKNQDMDISFKYPEDWPDVKYYFHEQHNVYTKGFILILGNMPNPATGNNLKYSDVKKSFESENISYSSYALLDLNGVYFKKTGRESSSENVVLAVSDNDTSILSISYNYQNSNTEAPEVFKQILSTIKRVGN